jgi:aminopeptidase
MAGPASFGRVALSCAGPDEIAERVGNKSMIHIDWMIGSDLIDIDGLDANGGRTPVFRKGEWA